MTDPRHPLARLIPSPNPDDIESAKWHLRHVVDAGLHALMLLDPDTANWEVPVGALDHLVEQEPASSVAAAVSLISSLVFENIYTSDTTPTSPNLRSTSAPR